MKSVASKEVQMEAHVEAEADVTPEVEVSTMAPIVDPVEESMESVAEVAEQPMEQVYSEGSVVQSEAELVLLRRVPNQSLQRDYEADVVVVNLSDRLSDSGKGALLLKQSCLLPAETSTGAPLPGFFDVVVSEDGSSLMGKYFRFESDGHGKFAPTLVDTTPQYLQEEWQVANALEIAQSRSDKRFDTEYDMKEEEQYGSV